MGNWFTGNEKNLDDSDSSQSQEGLTESVFDTYYHCQRNTIEKHVNRGLVMMSLFDFVDLVGRTIFEDVGSLFSDTPKHLSSIGFKKSRLNKKSVVESSVLQFQEAMRSSYSCEITFIPQGINLVFEVSDFSHSLHSHEVKVPTSNSVHLINLVYRADYSEDFFFVESCGVGHNSYFLQYYMYNSSSDLAVFLQVPFRGIIQSSRLNEKIGEYFSKNIELIKILNERLSDFRKFKNAEYAKRRLVIVMTLNNDRRQEFVDWIDFEKKKVDRMTFSEVERGGITDSLDCNSEEKNSIGLALYVVEELLLEELLDLERRKIIDRKKLEELKNSRIDPKEFEILYYGNQS